MCDLMYSCRGLDTMRESMPQTVPSAGFTPPSEYLHFAADYFDLSLLPSSPDLDLPPSPFSLLQGMSFYGDPANSPPSSLFGAQSQTQDDFKNQQQELQRPPVSVSNFHFVSPSTSTVIKEEPQPYRDTSCGFSSSGSPYPSMSQMTSPSPYEHMSHVSAASPMPSSPAGSTSSSSTSYQRCPTPHSIKHEQTIDLAHILSEHQVLQENVKEEGFRPQAKDRPGTSGRAQEIPSGSMFECITQVGGNGHVQQHKPYADESAGSGSDHKLLREFLRDPSFQKKYNLRPFEFAGLGSGFVVAEAGAGSGAGSSAATDEKLEGEDLQLSREKMEPVLRMAIQQLRKDVGDTCTQLGIAPDPTRWSSRDVEAWILWALHHYALPMINMEYFEMDGLALSALSEQDFQQRAPLCGSTLYAHLEIWKAACQDLDTGTSSATWNSSTSNSSTGDSSDDEDDETESAAAASPSVGTTSGGKMLSNRSSGGGGSHIHLWQFLKELLASPQLHGSCIRWLDRSKGVFKIEDSVRVARLWGKRKNRPAMNYDKLSRSIRQYYKKGIMKKTERSQRLVYQFCHPYCL